MRGDQRFLQDIINTSISLPNIRLCFFRAIRLMRLKWKLKLNLTKENDLKNYWRSVKLWVKFKICRTISCLIHPISFQEFNRAKNVVLGIFIFFYGNKMMNNPKRKNSVKEKFMVVLIWKNHNMMQKHFYMLSKYNDINKKLSKNKKNWISSKNPLWMLLNRLSSTWREQPSQPSSGAVFFIATTHWEVLGFKKAKKWVKYVRCRGLNPKFHRKITIQSKGSLFCLFSIARHSFYPAWLGLPSCVWRDGKT